MSSSSVTYAVLASVGWSGTHSVSLWTSAYGHYVLENMLVVLMLCLVNLW